MLSHVFLKGSARKNPLQSFRENDRKSPPRNKSGLPCLQTQEKEPLLSHRVVDERLARSSIQTLCKMTIVGMTPNSLRKMLSKMTNFSTVKRDTSIF